MKEKEGLTPSSFKTFYVSKENSSCPLIPEIMKIGKKIEEKPFFEKKEDIIISSRYGQRIISNIVGNNFEEIKKEDFIEIVDYNPVTKALLAIGKKDPRMETPIHWTILHAKKEINIIVQINIKDISKKILKNMEKMKKPKVEEVLEISKKILKKLRNQNIITIEDHGLIIVGKTFSEIENKIKKIENMVEP